MKKPTDNIRSSVYKEEFAFLEDAQKTLADPDLSRITLRTGYSEILAEHETLLRKIVKMTGISDRVQRKLREANSRIKVQREELMEKHLLLEKEIIKGTELGKQLQQRNQQLSLASQAKSAFLANMSHEIRTPMNAIIGLTHLALRTKPNPRQHDYLGKILFSADALLGIINDILDFSKIEAGKLEIEQTRFLLSDVMENLSDMLGPAAKSKGIEMLFATDSDVPSALTGDSLRLGQILINLSNNAIKFTDVGEIVIATKLIGMDENRVKLRFAVRDTGIGLSEKQIAELFRPFTQADVSTTREYGGTGLGLTICKRLVEMMNGDISVTSQLGQGSVFTFTAEFGLAAVTQTIKKGREHPLRTPEPMGLRVPESDDADGLAKIKNARVLLVEDNTINQQVATELLKQAGMIVTLAADGLKALKAVNQAAYYLVFMDIQMPKMDGYEASRAIRKDDRFADIPIIAMTAHAMSGIREKCLEAGMNDHMSKPINPPELAAALVRWIKPKAKKTPAPQPDLIFSAQRKIKHTQDLPERMPGLDISDALKRLDGNRKLLKKLLIQFADEYSDTAEILRKALDSGDIEYIRRTAHTIKGVAGNIGAGDLSKAARELEKAASAGNGPDDDALCHFEIALNLATASAITLESASLKAPVDVSDFAPNQAVDRVKLTSVLSEMDGCLERGQVKAAQFINIVEALLPGPDFREPLERLEEHIDNYDFDEAREPLAEIAVLLNITLRR